MNTLNKVAEVKLRPTISFSMNGCNEHEPMRTCVWLWCVHHT